MATMDYRNFCTQQSDKISTDSKVSSLEDDYFADFEPSGELSFYSGSSKRLLANKPELDLPAPKSLSRLGASAGTRRLLLSLTNYLALPLANFLILIGLAYGFYVYKAPLRAANIVAKETESSLAATLIGDSKNLTQVAAIGLAKTPVVPAATILADSDTAAKFSQVIHSFDDYLSNILYSFYDDMISLASGALAGWGSFLAGDSQNKAGSNTLTAQDREQLKQEIANEVKQSLINDDVIPKEGIVAGPLTGSSTVDMAKMKAVENSFSDPVKVDFDNSGKTGIVQPIFGDTPSQKYIFILTPVNVK